MTKFNSALLILLAMLFAYMASCGSDEAEYYPKPLGTMRMEFPVSNFMLHEPDSCPYSFSVPDYFTVVTDTTNCFADIAIDRFNAGLYLTYLPVDSNLLAGYVEQSHRLVYDHSIMADGIEETRIMNSKNRTYGLKYNITGNAATLFQFYVTDSTDHFMRGALVFNTKPNYDSLKPSLEYITRDIDSMINTLEWKY